MLFFNFSRVFKIKGINRPFKHLTSLGYSGNVATRLANDNFGRLNLSMIERICRDFNCTPNDLLDFRPYKDEILPKDHALHTLTKEVITNEVVVKINSLSIEKIQQIHDIIKNME
ncbi:MAG: helix-turn-helix transcriptional regulator [Flavobacterium sp.]